MNFNLFRKKPEPALHQLVTAFIMNTLNLELLKSEYVTFAPIKGSTPFKLSGNSLPIVEYLVFDKPTMEFIKIRVELKMDVMTWLATVESRGNEDCSKHGQVVDLQSEYKEPFELLLKHLYYYFPFYRRPLQLDANHKLIEYGVQNGAV